MTKRVLVISYLFPPTGNVGVLRTLRFIKWLPAFGWEPIVLTARNAKVQNLEPSLTEKVGANVPVYRSYSFEALNSGKSILGNGSNGQRSLLTRALYKVPTDLWNYCAVPDDKRGWVPFAIRTGTKVFHEHKFDAIYVSGKPFSSYFIGQALSERFGVPWIMDLRDLWTLNRLRGPKNWLHARLNPRLERRFIQSAATVVANTPGNRRDFIRQYPDCPPEKFVAITNGYDKDDFAGLEFRKHEKFTIAYSGTFYFRRSQLMGETLYETYSPRLLLQAVSELCAQDPTMRDRLQVLITGPGSDKIGGMVSEYGLEDVVKRLGWMEYRESLEVISRSHVSLLVLSRGEESGGWIPSKLYQYLGAGSSILAACPEGDVANIVRETKSGLVVPPDDLAAIKNAVAQMYDAYCRRRLDYDPQWELIERYEGRNLTQRLAECLDRTASECPQPKL